jgi:hypothetical protein
LSGILAKLDSYCGCLVRWWLEEIFDERDCAKDTRGGETYGIGSNARHGE